MKLNWKKILITSSLVALVFGLLFIFKRKTQLDPKIKQPVSAESRPETGDLKLSNSSPYNTSERTLLNMQSKAHHRARTAWKFKSKEITARWFKKRMGSELAAFFTPGLYYEDNIGNEDHSYDWAQFTINPDDLPEIERLLIEKFATDPADEVKITSGPLGGPPEGSNEPGLYRMVAPYEIVDIYREWRGRKMKFIHVEGLLLWIKVDVETGEGLFQWASMGW